ncbi:MAG: hypothetical protein ACOC1D_02110 [Prolixibacteraceae bacterium]
MGYFIRNHRFQILFALAGAAGGFLYWKFIGCNSGSCAIKSVWYWTTLWGTAVGYLAGDFISDLMLKRNRKPEEKK